jgi:hypothetical protein
LPWFVVLAAHGASPARTAWSGSSLSASWASLKSLWRSIRQLARDVLQPRSSFANDSPKTICSKQKDSHVAVDI